ncbi:MAG: DEAD/DEAH box helicase [Planctomycetota bacterium JB042]
MDVFELRRQLIQGYGDYVESFIRIRDDRVRERVGSALTGGHLWPDPLIQLNPSFEAGGTVAEPVDEGLLHEKCRQIFRIGKEAGDPGRPMRLHRHQTDAIRAAREGANYVLTTGTGSGKSLAYIVPIVDLVCREGSGKGIRAIVVYPMNALANSQLNELEKFLKHGFADGRGPVTFARYTGQEDGDRKREIIANPPDILLTNYVMLELILTRRGSGDAFDEKKLVEAARNLRFLVLDELHTYRGRQGADVALLVRRVREAVGVEDLQRVGTSATLAGPGTMDEQQDQVAAVATRLFGADVEPRHVITETLRRATAEADLEDPAFVDQVRARITDRDLELPKAYSEFVRDPLAIWVESTFGLTTEKESGRLVRADPKSVSGDKGAAAHLAKATGLEEQACRTALERTLLAGYECEPNPENGFPAFAFRLHQFISRGDTVYASLEAPADRFVTLEALKTAPDDAARALLPLVFCRECGQEYYSVRRTVDGDEAWYETREISDRLQNEKSEAGFLFVSDKAWPAADDQVVERVPEDWVEIHRGAKRIVRNRRDSLPQNVRVGRDGHESDAGVAAAYIRAPFRFCLSCGVSYSAQQRSDFGKVSTLASEGRSTATTILALLTVRALRAEEDLDRLARKLLSFTDNRQDASLQAGHFNDFVQVGLLRAALYRAAAAAGPDGIAHEALTQAVFDALGLDPNEYAVDPEAEFARKKAIDKALREVLGYRLYFDLRRGWRVTSPNLEQVGLLRIEYDSLDDLCASEKHWSEAHDLLSGADPGKRAEICRTLLDFMRRELAVKVDYLDPTYQERIEQQSSQHLLAPWKLDENERPESSRILFPRPRGGNEPQHHVCLSPLGAFGRYLVRPQILGGGGKVEVADRGRIIADLLERLRVAGLVEIVREPRNEDEVAGYQVPASSFRWVVGDGEAAIYDPIRVPTLPDEVRPPNRFFVDFYRTLAEGLAGLQAREHTAQVPYDEREDREEAFREGRLPVLFCSPTMELGIDIASLNAVNMRNVPPTPANYAQRSGRAGRSGQPALVFTYCATGSSHDQYFFRRPTLMVGGSVAPPALDLANEDLVKAHVHAIWLAETGQSLYTSLKDILDLSGDPPTLTLIDSVREGLSHARARQRARDRAQRVLESIGEEVLTADWYHDGWVDDALARVMTEFNNACDRWRTMYRGALTQAQAQGKIILDAARPAEDKARARTLRAEAEAQLRLLTDAKTVQQSDFYSYRYFASEGFLPGYNFPRLPLSAFIPGRRQRRHQKDPEDFLSRPRFLAITEFGPQSFVYHEGSRYVVNKVMLPTDEDGLTLAAKQCSSCGYLHHRQPDGGPDLCERCSEELPSALTNLFRMTNVSTRRRDRINSEEEERFRLGYEVRTAVRFAERKGRPSARRADLVVDGTPEATLVYGHASTLWRINLGWKRRKKEEEYGYWLDIERGFWARHEESEDKPDDDERMGPRKKRVIPFVEDRKNSLLLTPGEKLEKEEMASLQAALKAAIQVTFQLEESELAAEPLPVPADRRLLLFYESAEGGAGVLRRLVSEPSLFGRVVRNALDVCHFDPETGEDRRHAEHATEDCAAACYDCLMSYMNQPDHSAVDRFKIRDLLLRWRDGTVEGGESDHSPEEHFEQLSRLAGSELERAWLARVRDLGLRLPTEAQKRIESCGTTPDFYYGDAQTAVYVDGPHHAHPDRQARDRDQESCLEDLGLTVLRFGHQDDWDALLRERPDVFGVPEHDQPADRAAPAPPEASDAFEADLFDPAWRPLLERLAAIEGVAVDAGRDVVADGRVTGTTQAEVAFGDRRVELVAPGDDAERVRRALEAEGREALVLDPAAGDAFAAVTERLELRP